MNIQSVSRSYARYAPVYDHTFGRVLGNRGRAMAAAIAGRHARTVLEIGVGTGLTLPYYRRDLAVTGIDISPEMLERAQERVARERLFHVTALELMDASKLDYADNSFDAVVAAYVMSTVPDPASVLREVERVCVPGGDVVILNHFAEEKGLRSAVEKGLAPLSEKLGWRPDFRLDELLQRSALRTVRTRKLPPFGLFTLQHLRKAG